VRQRWVFEVEGQETAKRKGKARAGAV
jgi:hypothetical protein